MAYIVKEVIRDRQHNLIWIYLFDSLLSREGPEYWVEVVKKIEDLIIDGTIQISES